MKLQPFDRDAFLKIGKPVISNFVAGLTELDETVYHDDPTWGPPMLSHSIGKVLLQKSPLHAWIEHPRGGNVRREPTPAQARGTLIHGLVLGTISPKKPKPDKNIEVVDCETWRKKADQERKKALIAAGRLPMSATEWERYNQKLDDDWLEMEDAIEVAADIREQLRNDHGIRIGDGLFVEHVGIWEEATSFGPILCRCRLDLLHLNTAAIVDLKTANDANPKWLPKRIVDYGYDLQYGAYTSFIRKLLPDLAGREDFKLIFCEELPKGAPRRAIVMPAPLDGEFRKIGEAKWERATETWARCLASDLWPSYPIVDRVSPPAWEMTELEGAA